MKKPLIILLGGSSGVGTSTTAVELSNRIDITHIMETDYIREVLRQVIASSYSPILHCSSYNAYEVLPNYEWLSNHMEFEELVSTGFVTHISLIAPVVCKVIERAIDEVNNIIVEGVHWFDDIPRFQRFKRKADIYMFILRVGEETHKERFLKRAIERKRGGKHLGYFKEIRITHDYLVKQAEDFGIPVISTEKGVEDVVDEVLGYIKV